MQRKYDKTRYTIEEVAELFGKSVTSLKTNFTRTIDSINKKFGAIVTKCKDKDGIYYTIEIPRALTIFEEQEREEGIFIPLGAIKLNDLKAYIIVAVAAMPQGVFRGTAEQFLDYIGLSKSQKNIDLFNVAVNDFIEDEEGSYVFCKKDNVTVTIHIKDTVESELGFTINLLRDFKNLIEKNNKQPIKIVQLLKVWKAYDVMTTVLKWDPITDKDVMKFTDLGLFQIRDVKKLIDDPYYMSRMRKGTYNYCEGYTIGLSGGKDETKIIVKDDLKKLKQNEK